MNPHNPNKGFSKRRPPTFKSAIFHHFRAAAHKGCYVDFEFMCTDKTHRCPFHRLSCARIAGILDS